MNEFKISCENCGQHIRCDESYVGHQIPCPSCGKTLTVTNPGAAPPPDPRPRARLSVQASASPPPAPVARPLAPMAGRRSSGRSKSKYIVGAAAVVAGLVAGGVFMSLMRSGALPGWASWGGDEVAESAGFSPEEIVQRMRDKYASLSSYSSRGVSSITLDLSARADGVSPEQAAMPEFKRMMSQPQSITCDFSIRLVRPAQYRIEWEQSVGGTPTSKGAVWKGEEGIFILSGERRYHRTQNSNFALSVAAGHSSGAAQTVPAAFFDLESGMLMNVLKEFTPHTREEDSVVEGEECHVVSGDIRGAPATLWIRAGDFLVKQMRYELRPELMAQEFSDEEIRQLLLEMKRAPTPQMMDAMRNRLQQERTMAGRIQGSFTEVHHEIQVDPPLDSHELTVEIPQGARLMPFSF